jgi:hypothetical protein
VQLDHAARAGVELVERAQGVGRDERVELAEQADLARDRDDARIHGVRDTAGGLRGQRDRIARAEIELLRLRLEQHDRVRLGEVVDVPARDLQDRLEPRLVRDVDAADARLDRGLVRHDLAPATSSHHHEVELRYALFYECTDLRIVRHERGGLPRGDLEEAADVEVPGGERCRRADQGGLDPGRERAEQDEERGHDRDCAAEEERAPTVLDQVHDRDAHVEHES